MRHECFSVNEIIRIRCPQILQVASCGENDVDGWIILFSSLHEHVHLQQVGPDPRQTE